ncbi:MAG: THUMP-like domain-containing protein, partial [Saprospiraceae bacterium]
ENTAEHFDLLYLDPARRADRHRRVFQLADCEPNVLALREMLLDRADRVLLKTAPLLDISLAVKQLGAVSRVWVVSVANEVKEVLYLLEKSERLVDDLPIEAVCIGDETLVFCFTRSEERASEPEYALPQGYLYEPDAAVLKAGAFKTFASRFGLAKLHPQTHLYTSPVLVPSVPGRCFTVDAVVKYDRKAVREVLPDGRANVAVRHFPDKPEAVRQKLGLTDGGEFYLIGVTDADGRKVVVVGRKVFS